MPSLLDRIGESIGRIGREVAEHPIRTAADMTPGVGDVLAVVDAGKAALGRNWPMAGLALASVVPGAAGAVRGAKAGVKGSERALAKALEREAADQALRGLPVIERPEGIRTWHGSARRGLDRLSGDYIGTGEGANVYGPGVYLAENPEVAKHYRDTVGGQSLYVGDEEVGDLASLRNFYGEKSPEARVIDGITGGRPDFDRWVHTLPDELDNYKKRANWARNEAKEEWLHQWWTDELVAADRLKDQVRMQPRGAMYEVNLDVDPTEALDWNLRIDRQPAAVRDALRDKIHREWYTVGGRDHVRDRLQQKPLVAGLLKAHAGPMRASQYDVAARDIGNELSRQLVATRGDFAAALDRTRAAIPAEGAPRHGIWKAIELSDFSDWMPYLERHREPTNEFGGGAVGKMVLELGPQGARQELLRRGVPAIHYLDQGSRGKGGGTRNWVVLDDERMRIVRQLGLGGLLMLAAQDGDGEGL